MTYNDELREVPDFAHADLQRLADRDLKFLIENFPQPGRSYEEIAEVIHSLPNTLDSLLESEYVLDRILDQRSFLLDISPFLIFNVMLRRCLEKPRNSRDHKVINYVANLLSLFVKTERLHRVQPHDQKTYEYLVEMMEEASRADKRRQFMIYSHIGNYSLYLSGVFPAWIQYRHRYKRRPVDEKFYIDFGRTYFDRASKHPLARSYQLEEVFLRLALLFEEYRHALNRLSKQYLFPSNNT